MLDTSLEIGERDLHGLEGSAGRCRVEMWIPSE